MSCSEITDFTFTWKIENYSEKTQQYLESPNFIAENFLEESEWYLSYDCNDDFLEITLELKNAESITNESTRIGFTIIIVADDISSNISRKMKAKHYKFEDVGQIGFFKIASLKKILNERHLYLPQDTLTIQCYMIQKVDINGFAIKEKDSSASLQNFNNTRTLCKDLYDLYLHNKFCDVEIRTSDRVFPAHKTVVCARSPVFCAMFEDNTKEKKSGVVDIIDIDSDTVDSMLTFMYSDSVEENMNLDQAAELYAAADKYGILSLKDKCSTSLKSLLSCANVVDVYVLADMHQDVNLVSAVHNYVYVYAEKVCATAEWKHFMEVQPKLSAQLMQHLLMKHLDEL